MKKNCPCPFISTGGAAVVVVMMSIRASFPRKLTAQPWRSPPKVSWGVQMYMRSALSSTCSRG